MFDLMAKYTEGNSSRLFDDSGMGKSRLLQIIVAGEASPRHNYNVASRCVLEQIMFFPPQGQGRPWPGWTDGDVAWRWLLSKLVPWDRNPQ